MVNYRKNIDWLKIERLYKSGLISVSAISRQCYTSESNIRWHAKKHGWSRNALQEVQQRGRQLQVENLAHLYKPFEDKIEGMMDEQLIEEAARTQLEVVRQHQGTLKQGHSLAVRMLDELDASTSFVGELEKLIKENVSPSQRLAAKRALSLASRATVLRDLAQSAQTWVRLERQAFNIVDETKDKTQAPVETMTAEELRAEILKDAQKIGLDLKDADKPDGLANKVH